MRPMTDTPPFPPGDSPAAPSLSVFRHRSFRLFFGARFTATLAVQCEAVTIAWLVYSVARLSHSVAEGAFLVGMVGLAQFLPLFALTLIAGETADRYERKRVVQCCLAVQIACDLALLVISLHPSPSLTPIFAVAAVFGAARAFLQPAYGAMGPMLVPREELPRAIAWNSLGYQSGSVVGPFLGGVLVAISPAAAFGGAAVLYAVALVLQRFITTDTRPARQTGSRAALIREGVAYVWRNKTVFGAISLDLAAVLLGGATALLPVFARDILHVGAGGFGVLRAGPAIGASLTAFVLGRRPVERHAGVWMFGGVAVFGLATLVFAVSGSLGLPMVAALTLAVVALAVLGAADMISVYVRQSLVQIVTPDVMRGRVSAVSGLFIGASNELGEFETGLVARVLGPVGACLFGGFGSLAVTGLWARMFPALRRADRLTAPDA